ncbi:hypothetical protein [Roseateles sp. DXS20W]|uniref:hypothetical protein n=1 Tax=Pelomonas lactea TaxID=3299030 RepID=UPI00374A952A
MHPSADSSCPPSHAGIAVTDSPAGKLALEIQKLTGELRHQATQAQLTIEKLRLESEKLQLDLARAAVHDPLAQRKLELDIRELSRSPWLRPGTIIPLAATVGTILFAQFQGVFDVARRRLELSNLKLQIDSANLTAGNEQLRQKRETIDHDILKLAADREKLQETLKGLQKDKLALESRVQDTTRQLETMARRLTQVQTQAQIADTKARASYPAFRTQVLSDVYARVKATCRATTLPLFADERGTASQLEVRPRPDESTLLNRSRSGCIQEIVDSVETTRQLEAQDREALAEDVRQLSALIDELRRQALTAYADATQSTGAWVLNLPLDAPLSRSLRDSLRGSGQALPATEPLRGQWIEWRRRYLVELHYLNQTNGLLGQDWLHLSDPR